MGSQCSGKEEGENFKRRKTKSECARGTRGAAPRVWVGGDLERASVVALGEGGGVDQERAQGPGLGGTHLLPRSRGLKEKLAQPVANQIASLHTNRTSNPRIHHYSTDSLVQIRIIIRNRLAPFLDLQRAYP